MCFGQDLPLLAALNHWRFPPDAIALDSEPGRELPAANPPDGLRTKFLIAGLLFRVALGCHAGTHDDLGSSPLALWYDRPAAHWIEALPVGNGRMGAMVFGGVTNERVQFSEQTLWTGTNATQKTLGQNAVDGAMGDYQPFGDVFLRFPETPKIRNLTWLLSACFLNHANNTNF